MGQKAEIIEKIKKKVQKLEKSVPQDQGTALKTGDRRNVLKLYHCYHLLNLLGVEPSDQGMYLEPEVRSVLVKSLENVRSDKDIISAGLIDKHTDSWNLAEYQYEKASKILCQMMITAMDYMLITGRKQSVLYPAEQKTDCERLIFELEALEKKWLESFAFLCVYDYYTLKIAEFTGVTEYKYLAQEHQRIISNGLPDKVTRSLELLSADLPEQYQERIETVFNAQPIYDSGFMNILYEDLKKTRYQSNDLLAMLNYLDSFFAMVALYKY